MPVSVVKKYAEIYGVPEEEMEAVWNEAKEVTRKKFKLPKDDSKWEDEHWAYTMGVFKRMVKNKYGTTPALEDYMSIIERS